MPVVWEIFLMWSDQDTCLYALRSVCKGYTVYNVHCKMHRYLLVNIEVWLVYSEFKIRDSTLTVSKGLAIYAPRVIGCRFDGRFYDILITNVQMPVIFL